MSRILFETPRDDDDEVSAAPTRRYLPKVKPAPVTVKYEAGKDRIELQPQQHDHRATGPPSESYYNENEELPPPVANDDNDDLYYNDPNGHHQAPASERQAANNEETYENLPPPNM